MQQPADILLHTVVIVAPAGIAEELITLLDRLVEGVPEQLINAAPALCRMLDRKISAMMMLFRDALRTAE